MTTPATSHCQTAPAVSFLDGAGYFFFCFPALLCFIMVCVFQAASHAHSARLLGFPLFWCARFPGGRLGGSCPHLWVSVTSRKLVFKKISIETFFSSEVQQNWSGQALGYTYYSLLTCWGGG